MKKQIILFIAALPIFFILACSENTTPKPHGYIRITFPEKKYDKFIQPEYEFDKPVYTQTENAAVNGEKGWINLCFPQMNAKIHLSLKKINNNFDTLIDDAHTMAYKHAVKADAIESKAYENDSANVFGLMYDIKGNVASPIQFFLTDSSKYFLRGSLYFNFVPDKDSLEPSVNFIRQDIEKIFETIRWK